MLLRVLAELIPDDATIQWFSLPIYLDEFDVLVSPLYSDLCTTFQDRQDSECVSYQD